jgi:hypothetical protein
MEWIEIVDTGLKIGLGAAISGIATYQVTKRNHSHEFDREYFKRRQSALEQISESFELIHKFLLEVSADNVTYIKGYISGISPTSEITNLFCSHTKELGNTLKEMHIMEGKLLLNGLPEATNCLREYRLLAVEVNNALSLQKPTRTDQEMHDISERLCSKKDSFYSLITKPYQKI